MISEQLVLWAHGSTEYPRVPWGGASPRVLTAAYERFILKPRAQKSVSDFVRSVDQFDLWLPMEKAPWKYQGAPLLSGRVD